MDTNVIVPIIEISNHAMITNNRLVQMIELFRTSYFVFRTASRMFYRFY